MTKKEMTDPKKMKEMPYMNLVYVIMYAFTMSACLPEHACNMNVIVMCSTRCSACYNNYNNMYSVPTCMLCKLKISWYFYMYLFGIS